jgi:hypothetical protein
MYSLMKGMPEVGGGRRRSILSLGFQVLSLGLRDEVANTAPEDGMDMRAAPLRCQVSQADMHASVHAIQARSG